MPFANRRYCPACQGASCSGSRADKCRFTTTVWCVEDKVGDSFVCGVESAVIRQQSLIERSKCRRRRTILTACSSSIWTNIITARNPWSRTVLLAVRMRQHKGIKCLHVLVHQRACHQSHSLPRELFHLERVCARDTDHESGHSCRRKLPFNTLAQAARGTLCCVLCPSVGPSRPIRMTELVGMGASG